MTTHPVGPFDATPNHTITSTTHTGCDLCDQAVRGALLVLSLNPGRPATHHTIGWTPRDAHRAYVRRELPAPWTPATSALAQKLRAAEPLTPPHTTENRTTTP